MAPPDISRELSREEEAVGLQELSPSPVEDTPIDTSMAEGGYFPDTTQAKQQPFGERSGGSTSTLGLSGHSTIWWLTRIQRYTTYASSAFLALHIANTSLLPLLTQSVPAAETYLLLTRPYYQSQPLETLLVAGPVVLHVASGLGLRLYRRAQSVKWYGAESRAERRALRWPRVSRQSALGWMLFPLVVAHAGVNRGLPLAVEGGSSGVGLGFVSHAFERWPAVSWATYTLLVTVGSWHFVGGWAKWLGLDADQAGDGGGGDAVDRGTRRKWRVYGVNATAAALAGLWMAGGLGVVARGGAMGGWQGRAWDEMLKRVPVMGNYV